MRRIEFFVFGEVMAQNALQCEEDMLNEMDVNLVETSSHMGARPSHAEWQGKVFWRKYPEGNYENFYQATGYGTATGLGGYNCRHQFYAFFGEDDEETYEHIDETVNKQAYEMEQKQRSLERKLRKWDREKKILEAGGQDTTEAKKWKRYYQEQLKNLIDSSDGFLKRNYSAEKAYNANVAKTGKTEKYSDSLEKARATVKKASITTIKEADEVAKESLGQLFEGYVPGKLVYGDESEATLFQILSPGINRINRTVSNTATSAGTSHVNIENDALANSLHERGHDLLNQLALKVLGVKEGSIVDNNTIQKINKTKLSIISKLYLKCFTNESYDEIMNRVEQEISPRAKTQSELLPEALVEALGKEKLNELAVSVLEAFKEEWLK